MRAMLPLLFILIVGTAWADDPASVSLKPGLAVSSPRGFKDALAGIPARAPSVLPGVSAEMRTPGFWIARHPAPDAAVLNTRAVSELNRRIIKAGLARDIGREPVVFKGVTLRAEVQAIIDGLKKKTLYDADGKQVPPGYVAGFDREVAAIADKVQVLYGFIIKTTDERLLPTDQPLYAEPGDVDFDEVQNSGLDIGTPVVVLAHSRDRKWLFVHEAISSGWVRADSVARTSRDVFRQRADTSRPLVVTSPRVDLFLDKEMTEYLGAVRMGKTFAYKDVSAAYWEVDVPAVDVEGEVKYVPAYIPKQDASAGFLPFTPRVVYGQAFKLLDAPYGWGDMNGGQDCSRFIQMVFASVGIRMPRNSSGQREVGRMLAGFKPEMPAADKEALITAKARGAATLLGLQGHIMLYLGAYDNKPYAIHATWAYREPMPDGAERKRIIGRVAVTSLEPGAGSSKGSYLQRVISAKLF